MQERQYGSIQFLTGPLKGQTVSITKPEIQIGRDPGQCDIVINQDSVSRLHAKIMCTDAGWSIEKLALQNIVTVNQKKLSIAPLVTGDIVGLGTIVSFRFSIAEHEQTQKLERSEPPLQQHPISPLLSHHVSPPAPRPLVPSTPPPENAVTLRYTPPAYVPDVVDLSDSSTPPAPSALPAHQLQTALDELRLQQEIAVTQLRNEVHTLSEQLQLGQQAREKAEKHIQMLEGDVTNLKADVFQLKPRQEIMPKLPWLETTIIAVVTVISTILLIFFFNRVYFDHPALRQNHVATDIVGNILTVLGSVYLAYDLLGRKNGILLWLTQFVSSALISIVPFELIAFALTFIPLGGLLKTSGFDLDFDALKVVCIGIVLAGFGGMWIGIPVSRRRGHLSPQTIFGGFVGTSIYWLVFIFAIITPEYSFIHDKQHLLELNWSVVLPVVIGVLILGGLSSFALDTIRSYFGDISSETARNMQEDHVQVFSKRGFEGGALIGFCTFFIIAPLLSLILFLFYSKSLVLSSFLLVMLIMVAIFCVGISALAGSIVRYVFWFVNHVPEQYIGIFGLILALSGAMLLFVHPFLDLLNAVKGP